MNKDKFKNIIIVLLLIIIILLVIVIGFSYATLNNIKTDSSDDKTNNEEVIDDKLSKDEALKVGKELYDKATDIYETWVLFPYCGFTYQEFINKDMVEYSDAAMGNGKYYDSGFKNLEELKEYLAKYLSSDIINNKITKDAVIDLSLLGTSDYAYTDYIVDSGKLYCRSFAGKGWVNRYLGEYDIDVNTIEENKITYIIKSTYVTEAAQASNSECWNSVNSGTNELNTDKCLENELEYKDTTFIIEKNNDNWIVSEYTLHD